MQRNYLNRPLHLFIAAVLIATMLFGALSTSWAQDTSTPTPSGSSPVDDSDDLPVYINITGYVQEVTATTIKINDIVNIIPVGMKLPTGIAVGKVVSIHGNLRNDDTIIIIIIAPGYQLPTSTPQGTPSATPAATESGTPPATLPATLEATIPPGGTPPVVGPPVTGCNKPRQELAVVISGAYAVPYAKVVDLHCKGYSFGEIARAYLLVLAGNDEGKTVTVAIVLGMRARGNRWRVIIIILDLHPDSTLIVFVINGGRGSFFMDCGKKGNRKKSKVCVIVTQGGSGGSGGGEHNDDD
jgi:hypothetical protein